MLFMRVFIAVLVLILALQSWTKADDIRDFEIEGISIGDSLLNHFTKKELDNALEIYNYPGSNKFIYYFLKKKNFETYKYIQVHVNPLDKNFIVESIEGHIQYKIISECHIKMKSINKELENLLNINSVEDEGAHVGDLSGNSVYKRNMLYFPNDDYAEIICYDMSKDLEKQGKTDRLVVSLSTSKFMDFLNYDAYK